MIAKATCLWAVLILLGGAREGSGQVASTPAPPAQPPSASTPARRSSELRAAVGRSVVIQRDEEVREAVVVIGGNLRIDGIVRGDAAVVGGDLELGPDARVGGEVAVVGGKVRRAAGAMVAGGISDIRAPVLPRWPSRGEIRELLDFDALPRPPIGGVSIGRAAVLAVLMVIVLAVARGRVVRVAGAAGARPIRSLLVGLCVEVLFVPVLVLTSVLLAVTVIGIPFLFVLLPVALFGAAAMLLLGFTGLAVRVGGWVERLLGLGLRSVVVASGLGLLVIMGPTLLARWLGGVGGPSQDAATALVALGIGAEFLVWTMGLGAAVITRFGRRALVPPPLPA